jgi:hypothetical protein
VLHGSRDIPSIWRARAEEQRHRRR